MNTPIPVPIGTPGFPHLTIFGDPDAAAAIKRRLEDGIALTDSPDNDPWWNKVVNGEAGNRINRKRDTEAWWDETTRPKPAPEPASKSDEPKLPAEDIQKWFDEMVRDGQATAPAEQPAAKPVARLPRPTFPTRPLPLRPPVASTRDQDDDPDFERVFRQAVVDRLPVPPKVAAAPRPVLEAFRIQTQPKVAAPPKVAAQPRPSTASAFSAAAPIDEGELRWPVDEAVAAEPNYAGLSVVQAMLLGVAGAAAVGFTGVQAALARPDLAAYDPRPALGPLTAFVRALARAFGIEL